MWETKNPSSRDFKYRWDNVSSFLVSGNTNVTEEISKCPYFSGSGQGDIESCTADLYRFAVNLASLCGSSAWDIPAVKEMKSIVMRGKHQPSVDENYFPFTQHNYYWSSEGNAYTEFGAWAVDFSIGEVNDVKKTEFIYVQLVSRGMSFK